MIFHVISVSLFLPCGQAGSSGVSCAFCAAGTYASVTGSTSCVPCSAGMFQVRLFVFRIISRVGCTSPMRILRVVKKSPGSVSLLLYLTPFYLGCKGRDGVDGVRCLCRGLLPDLDGGPVLSIVCELPRGHLLRRGLDRVHQLRPRHCPGRPKAIFFS